MGALLRLAFLAPAVSLLSWGALRADSGRTDTYGDPLPPGALFRFGCVRWRHGHAISASALSPDGKVLATAGDHSVIVWDVETGRPKHRFPCEAPLTSRRPGLSFSPDGRRLAYAHSPGFALAWNLPAGKQLFRVEVPGEHQDAVCPFTPDGKELALVAQNRLQFVDPETGKEIHSPPVSGVSLLSPDARTYVWVEDNHALVLGDARTGRKTGRVEVATACNGVENGIAFSPDGRLLAVVEVNKAVQVRDGASGNVRISFRLPEAAMQKDWHPDYRVGFTADGRTLFLGTVDGVIHRWDLVTKRELPPLIGERGLPAGLHALPDGRTLVSTGGNGWLRRWDARTGRELKRADGYWSAVRSAFSPNGELVAVAEVTGRLDLWDAARGKPVRTVRVGGPAGVASFAFAPDGRTLAAACCDDTLRFWEVPSGREVKVLRRGMESGQRLFFSPNGRSLYEGRFLGESRLLETTSGTVCWQRGGALAPAADFSPDGLSLVVAGTGPCLTFLDAAAGTEQLSVRVNEDANDNDHVEAVAFSPDGRRLAAALLDGHIYLCDARTGVAYKRLLAVDVRPGLPLDFGGPGNQVHTVAFSPDGKWLASGGSDGAVRVWDVGSGQEAFRLDGHEGDVLSVAFGPDGRTVLSGGSDAQAYLWDLRPEPAGTRRKSLEALWADLVSGEGGPAYRAVWALRDDPGAAGFLRDKLSPTRLPDGAHLRQLITDLDAEAFRRRETAARALAVMGRVGRPALEEALTRTRSPEARRRIRELLEGLDREPSAEEVRGLRAVQALELAGSPGACAALRTWADGAPGALLTEDARAALARQEKRRHPPAPFQGQGKGG